MRLERWHEVESLFQRAVEQPPDLRRGFLRRAAGDAAGVLREVENLLRADESAGSYMEWPTRDRPFFAPSEAAESADGSASRAPLEADDASAGHRLPGERIGPFRLLKVLGEGGMGTVYLARQETPIRRRVALKLIRSGLPRQEVLRRFDAERQALARMQHPNVAQVLEAGTTESGRSYLAMEYIPGLPITDFCDRHRLDVRRRLELFIQVCQGVQHLHQKAIIHRDLKPSNVLVMEGGGDPIPKIIDFGIAKAMDRPLTDETLVTGDRLLGTPAYLSPEALRPRESGAGVDTRSDVYALGVLLYEILTGLRPFGARGESLRQIVGQIVAGEAPPPSARLAAHTAADGVRRGAAAGRVHRLRGDLDWITLKAMARDPDERYASAAELAADLSRHLKHRPVSAGPPTLAYRIAKFSRRHKAGAAAALLIALVLIAGFVARTLEAQRANREAARANREAEASKRVAAFMVDLFEVSDPYQAHGGDLTVEQVLKRGAEKIASELADQPVIRARLMDAIGTVYRKMGLLEDSLPLMTEALALRRRFLGDEHLETATSLNHLGVLHVLRGAYDLAGPLLSESVEIRSRLLGARHPGVSTSLNDLAILHARQASYREAEELFRRALAIREEALKPDAPDLAASYDNLANLYKAQGRNDEAAPLYRRAIAIREKVLGPDHPDLATSLVNTANLYTAQSRYPEAEPLYRRALGIQEKALGAGHPNVATCLLNLARLCLEESRYREAETLYQRSLEIFEAALGSDHPHLAQPLLGLAELDRAVGCYRRAEPRLRRASSILEKAFGSEHADVEKARRATRELRRQMALDQAGDCLEKAPENPLPAVRERSHEATSSGGRKSR